MAQLQGSRFAAVAQVETPAQSESAWNLATLGVHPGSQGQGLGGAMIQAGLAAVDESSAAGVAGVFLETSDQRNVRLYERAGFSLTATTLIEQGPPVYSMLRTAPAAGSSTSVGTNAVSG